jgi:mannose-6-phosphate isomerase-like protein (cupin superfamily)
MAKSGEVLDNPVTGQRIIFRRTSGDTAGGLLEVESVYTTPSPSRPPAHYHPSQEEIFRVLAGELHVVTDGRQRVLKKGETLVIVEGAKHQMWAEEAGVRVNWQTRPALETAAFFETVYGLAARGETNEKGTPHLLQAAVIARAYSDEFRLARPPWTVQRLLFAVLAPVGRLLGYPTRISR